MQTFDKEAIKKSIIDNVKNQFRKTIDEATPQQVYQAVAYAVKDVIIDNWIATQKTFDDLKVKKVYYLSMEFLMGRALGNNIINLGEQKEIREALEELGFDLNAIEDQEPDPALGNGGLGRLAACFLDSLATLGYPAYGCGIRYHYGMFKQKIENGYQIEVPDEWLKNGYPFEIRRAEYATEVKFGGYVKTVWNGQRNVFVQEGYQSVLAVPYDMPIVGYGNNVVNTLRIWDAQPINTFSLTAFDKGDYQKAVEQDDAYWEDAAAREGLSTEQYKRMKKLEAENQTMRAARENAERLAQKEQIFAKWNTEAEELGRLYRGFDLRTEVNNPDFVKLLGAGIPMRTAYETLHHDEIMSGAMEYTARKVAKKQIDAIKAGQSRPAEGAAGSTAAFQETQDVNKLSGARIMELARRSLEGETITPDKFYER